MEGIYVHCTYIYVQNNDNEIKVLVEGNHYGVRIP